MTKKIEYSSRAKQGLTNQLKAQLKFLQDDLKHEKAALAKCRAYQKYNLPGFNLMLGRHITGVAKTERDIRVLKQRIRTRQKNGQIFKIL